MVCVLAALPQAGAAQRGPATPWPSGRAGHAMAYDAVRGETVLFGGDSDLASQTADSLWTWSGTEWRVHGAAGPGWLTLPALAFDARRGRIVLFGGLRKHAPRQYADQAESDTWEWDGSRWERRDVNSPGRIDHHAMAFDEARGRIVMQGGGNRGRILAGATWTYDGERWTMAADAASGPGQRVHHAMAYDGRRQRVVLFGGLGEQGLQPADVWEWDGERWHRIAATGPGPGARSHHRMAFDAARGVTVLYGGSDDTVTWTWDGTQWRRAAETGPPARWLPAMAWDARRGRVVLYGGGESTRADLWEWDGIRWHDVRH